MHFLTIVKPGPAPPPVDIIRSAEEWIDGKLSDGTFECCYAFVQGGGFSVGKADSLEDLMDDLLEYPLSPFVEFDVRPLVGLDHAFERFIETAERMAVQAG